MWMVSKNKTNLILLRRGNIIKLYPFRVFLITVSSISSIPLRKTKIRNWRENTRSANEVYVAFNVVSSQLNTCLCRRNA